jgi:glycosyltransferase involved in cell wall biosynthesis
VSGRRRHDQGERYDAVFYVPSIAPLLAQDPARPAGGAETQIRLLTRALVAAGLRVAVVAYDHPGLPDVDEGVVVLRRPPHHRSPLAEARTILRSLRQAPSDVVVTRQAGAHTGVVAVVAKLTGRRFVYSAANVIDFQFTSFQSHRAKSLLFELGLRLADQVVAQTDEQQELCTRKLGRTPPVIRSLAEPAPVRTAAPEAFLWAGRVMGYKQPLAYVELARAVPEARFWMVAVPDDALEEDRLLLARLTQEAAGVPNLQVLPPRRRSELLELVERSVAVVSTSRSEGMPNIWLEGWSRGVPALTLEHDPDALIRRLGLGMSCQGDPHGLAAAARGLWASRDDQTDLSDRCRAYVAAEHSPAAVAQKWRTALGLGPRVTASDTVTP